MVDSVVDSSRAMLGSAGRYMSMDSGPSATSAPSTSTSRPAAGVLPVRGPTTTLSVTAFPLRVCDNLSATTSKKVGVFRHHDNVTFPGGSTSKRRGLKTLGSDNG